MVWMMLLSYNLAVVSRVRVGVIVNINWMDSV
jgi:hypothetical protein